MKSFLSSFISAIFHRPLSLLSQFPLPQALWSAPHSGKLWPASFGRAASFINVNANSLAYNLTVGILRLALICSLIFAGLSIYRGLPGGDDGEAGGESAAGQTALQIVLRTAPEESAATLNIKVELYPVDLSATQREYLSERRPGVRFDDFLARRMEGKSIVETKLDERGQATLMVAPGKWWVHATLDGTHKLEWRLPVNVAGPKQTVELTPENAYAKMKSF